MRDGPPTRARADPHVLGAIWVMLVARPRASGLAAGAGPLRRGWRAMNSLTPGGASVARRAHERSGESKPMGTGRDPVAETGWQEQLSACTSARTRPSTVTTAPSAASADEAIATRTVPTTSSTRHLSTADQSAVGARSSNLFTSRFPFGNQAVSSAEKRSTALRPRLATGLPLSREQEAAPPALLVVGRRARALE
jgi:hypothetical protein